MSQNQHLFLQTIYLSNTITNAMQICCSHNEVCCLSLWIKMHTSTTPEIDFRDHFLHCFIPSPRLSLVLWPVTIQLANSPTGCSSVTYHPSTRHLFRRLFDSLFWRPFSLCHWCLSSWTHSEQLPVWAHLAHGKQCIGKGNWRSNSVSRRTTQTYHILIYTSILLSQL